MPQLEISEDTRIYYETAGTEGPWITLINGHTRPLSDFKSMTRYLVERGNRVLSFDNRGVGKTDCPAGFSLEDIAKDVVALWDHLQIPKCTVLGISFGGTVALTLASETAPDRVERLLLVSTAISDEHLSVEKEAPPRDPRRLIMNMTRYFSLEFAQKNPMIVQGFIRQVARTYQDPELALGARTQRDAMEHFDFAPALEKIRARTLVLHGEKDQIVPVESAKKIAAGIPKAKLETFPVGHLLLVEMPVAFYERIQTFTREQETSP